MMGFRGVHSQDVFIGDLCFVAGIGMLISAQWELVRGDTFAYTVLSAFGKCPVILPGFGGYYVRHMYEFDMTDSPAKASSMEDTGQHSCQYSASWNDTVVSLQNIIMLWAFLS